MLAAILFGLEENILVQCSSKEIDRYKRLSIFFLILIAIGIISVYYFFYLLTQNYIYAFFGAIVLSFIYFSILRFTIITINVSLHDEMTMKRMLRNYANSYRILLFSAFVFTILVPLIALINHNNFGDTMNSYKKTLNAEYQKNRLKAKGQQLSALYGDIADLKKQKSALAGKLSKANTSMDRGLTEFEMRKIDTLAVMAIAKFNRKDSILALDNKVLMNRYELQLLKCELPFFRFQLVFKSPIPLLSLLVLFLAFILIIPFYIRALVSKDSNYAKLYKEKIKKRILNEYELGQKYCSEILEKNHSYKKISSSLYEDSPFNTKAKTLPYKRVIVKNMFDHFKKEGSTISTNG